MKIDQETLDNIRRQLADLNHWSGATTLSGGLFGSGTTVTWHASAPAAPEEGDAYMDETGTEMKIWLRGRWTKVRMS